MLLRGIDVGSLSFLASAAKQDNDHVSSSSEVNSIPWAEIDSELMHAISNRLAVPKVPVPDANESCANDRSGSNVLN
jgi:hypothetical protein